MLLETRGATPEIVISIKQFFQCNMQSNNDGGGGKLID